MAYVKKTYENMTPRQIQYASVICIIGMLFVLFTHLIRAGLDTIHSSAWIVFIFGVLPNFGAALSLPFLMIVFITRLKYRELHGRKFDYCFIVCLGAAFFSLSAWEIIQYLSWGYPMDPNDIAATGLGVIIAFIAYVLFLRTAYPPNRS